MRKILVHATSKNLSQKDLWRVMTTLEEYPNWCKFCEKITSTEVTEGAVYEDVTTLLWIPIKVKHVITKIKPAEEFHTFLPLPARGKMWHKYTFKQKDNHALMTTEITFDLGNKLFNHTVGRILQKRFESLLLQGFPGLDEIKILQ